jgi:hypothetical protein
MNIQKSFNLSITVEDYFNYVGTNPPYSEKERMLQSLPSELIKSTILEFEKVRVEDSYSKWYKVSLTADLSKEQLESMLHSNSTNMHKFKDLLIEELN